jgi:hypothetical protein
MSRWISNSLHVRPDIQTTKKDDLRRPYTLKGAAQHPHT